MTHTSDYDDLRPDEQARVRDQWATRIAERLETVDVGADRHGAGKPYVALDADGNVVNVHPGGTTTAAAPRTATTPARFCDSEILDGLQGSSPRSR